MSLHLLHTKSWHVWSADNVERVRRDEAARDAEQEQDRKRALAVEAEARVALLRRRVGVDDASLALRSSSVVGADVASHAVPAQAGNPEYAAEAAAALAKQRRAAGIVDYTLRDVLPKAVPWYAAPPSRNTDALSGNSSSHGVGDSAVGRAEVRKAAEDPMIAMGEYLAASRRAGEARASMASTAASIAPFIGGDSSTRSRWRDATAAEDLTGGISSVPGTPMSELLAPLRAAMVVASAAARADAGVVVAPTSQSTSTGGMQQCGGDSNLNRRRRRHNDADHSRGSSASSSPRVATANGGDGRKTLPATAAGTERRHRRKRRHHHHAHDTGEAASPHHSHRDAPLSVSSGAAPATTAISTAPAVAAVDDAVRARLRQERIVREAVERERERVVLLREMGDRPTQVAVAADAQPPFSQMYNPAIARRRR